MPRPTRQAEPIVPVETRFIPARPRELARAIAEDPARFGEAAETAHDLRHALDRVISQEIAAFHDACDEAYAALNPDEDTPLDTKDDTAESAAEKRLLDALRYVLDKANFTALSQVEIDAALRAGTSYGVRVHLDPNAVEHLALHVRGVATTTRKLRVKAKPWHTVEIPVDVYRRLVVVTRLKNETGIRLKLFRDIPVRDVEALMPHARVKMSLVDQIQVYGGGAGALGGLGSKLVPVLTGGVVSASTLGWAAVIAFGGLAYRSFTGYRRTRHRRTSQRTQNLYDRNLANNAAVLHALLRMIRQEEVKEALLVYCVLASADGFDSPEDIDTACEAWITNRFGRRTDFDCPDALETLDRLGLWQDKQSHTVLPPQRTLAKLDDHWHHRRTENYHLTTTDPR